MATRRGLFLATGAVALAAGAALVFVRVYPQLAAHFPKCVFHELSGLHCTGCGSTRAVYALLRGDLGAAWAQNPLLVVVLPWLGWKVSGRAFRFFGWTWPVRTWPVRTWPVWTWPVRGIELPGKWHWLFAALVIAFTVVRNLPGGEFLGPRE